MRRGGGEGDGAETAGSCDVLGVEVVVVGRVEGVGGAAAVFSSSCCPGVLIEGREIILCVVVGIGI